MIRQGGASGQRLPISLQGSKAPYYVFVLRAGSDGGGVGIAVLSAFAPRPVALLIVVVVVLGLGWWWSVWVGLGLFLSGSVYVSVCGPCTRLKHFCM